MNDMTEIQTILSELSEKVKNNHPISVSQWIDAASHLNLLMLEVEDELVKAEMEVNRLVTKHLEQNMPVAKAKALAKGTDAYGNYLSLKGLKETVIETVRLSKKRVEMETWDQ